MRKEDSHIARSGADRVFPGGRDRFLNPRRERREALLRFIRRLMEEALAGGGTVISLTLRTGEGTNHLELALESNLAVSQPDTEGHGVAARLGDQRLERAGVRFARRDSGLGGEAVRLEIPLASSGDDPTGALIALLAEQACRHDEADFWCRFQLRDRARTVWVSDLARSMPRGDYQSLNLSLEVARRLNALYSTESLT